MRSSPRVFEFLFEFPTFLFVVGSIVVAATINTFTIVRRVSWPHNYSVIYTSYTRLNVLVEILMDFIQNVRPSTSNETRRARARLMTEN